MFELDLKKFKVSERTIKTSIAAGICIFLFRLLERGSPMLACLAAVFAMRGDTSTTFYYGVRRVIASILSGILAVLLASAKQVTGWDFFIDLFGVMAAIVIFIVLSNVFDLSEGIIGGMATFLIIYFNIPANENIIYTMQQFLDTLIGTLIAVGVNYTFSKKLATK